MATATARRVLVTGGAGFLGSHLCEQLLNLGQEVSCVDNFFSSSRQNVAHLLGNPRFELMRHDVTFPLYAEVDEIFNLACPASPVHYQFDPVQTTKTSVLARSTCSASPSASSSRSFRPRPRKSTATRMSIPRPRLLGERQPDRFQHRATMKVSVVQRLCSSITVASTICQSKSSAFSTPTGRGCILTTAGLFRNFIVQALKGEDITIFGDGRQTRSFCYVDDLVDGLLRMMETSPDVTGPLNIGNPKEFTIIELAELVIEMTATKSKVRFEPLPSDDPRQRRPDISRAKAVLGWEPKTQLREGLVRTIAYFDKLFSEGATPVLALRGIK